MTGLYLTSQEASVHMTKNAKSTLFVDIRDPAEILSVGIDYYLIFPYK